MKYSPFLLLLFILSCSKQPEEMPLTVKVDGLEISGFKGHYKNNMLTLFKGEGIEPAMDSEYKIEFRLSDNYRNTTIQFPNENSSTPPLALNIHDPERNINTVWLKQTKFKITLDRKSVV